ncbi:MAG: tRNA (adenosine(37)-N6)-threonylcarbamoyltransferase complex ATPase subunit type 1 TsaE [Victivallaceae bacterium]|nr:tRNA (adenosine(37)-N6)-threonylcarbamoyltransferase complex ATPase subunit type 1 TsaE [Victivallaceae bacterium]
MSVPETVSSFSEQDTEALGASIARRLRMGAVVLLNGDLGAGKTVFARGFARALGITEPVSSPTYTIVQEYELPEGRGRLYHLDLYRISSAESALGFGIDEFLADKRGISLVEWPERAAGLMPPDAVSVSICHVGESERAIDVVFPD